MQISIWANLAVIAVLSTSLFITPAYADDIKPSELPKTLAFVKQNGKLHTQGFYLPPQSICLPLTMREAPSPESIKYSLYTLTTLSRAWDFSTSPITSQPTFKFKISKDGSLEQSSILRSGGDAKKDEAILAGIKKVFPIQPYSLKTGFSFVTYVLTPENAQFYATQPTLKELELKGKEFILPVEWVRSIHETIKKFWKVPFTTINSTTGLVAVYNLTVDTQTGEILDSYLSQSSCNQEFDQSIENALKRVTTFPKPKKSLPHKIVSFAYPFTATWANYLQAGHRQFQRY